MGAPKKSIEEYEKEASFVEGCLVHPTSHVARKLYQLRHGALPSTVYVCHKCDTPECILDNHHFTGSAQDNVIDSVNKGRHSCFRKGGVRFSGPHSAEAKSKISAASFRMWNGETK